MPDDTTHFGFQLSTAEREQVAKARQRVEAFLGIELSNKQLIMYLVRKEAKDEQV